MQLFLCRHGRAGESRRGDFFRELTPEGARELRELFARPQIAGCRVDMIISSPAARAMQTAEIAATSIGNPIRKHEIITADAIYEQNTGAMLRLVASTADAIGAIWLFGHNPSLALLAASLTTTPGAANPPGTVTAVEFDFTGWGQILNLTTPGRLLFREMP